MKMTVNAAIKEKEKLEKIKDEFKHLAVCFIDNTEKTWKFKDEFDVRDFDMSSLMNEGERLAEEKINKIKNAFSKVEIDV